MTSEIKEAKSTYKNLPKEKFEFFQQICTNQVLNNLQRNTPRWGSLKISILKHR